MEKMKNRRGRKVLAAMLAVLLIQGTGGNSINGWENRNVQAAEDSAGGLSGAEPTEPAAEAAASTASEPHAGPSAPASSEPTAESASPVPSEPVTEPPVSVPSEPATEPPAPASSEPATESPAPAPSEPATEPPAPASSEPATESPAPAPSEPATEPASPASSEPVTEQPSTNPSAAASGEIHLGIDNRHLYSGMTATYSQGYAPTTTVSSATLVVPFTADGPLKNDRLTVSLEFASTGTVPFEMKNYQKDVDKKTVCFDRDGKALKKKEGAAESTEAYVYRVKLQFLSTAEPGQYPVTVKALGYTEKGEKVTLEYRLFVRIPEKDDSDVVVIGGDEPAGGGGEQGGGGGIPETEKIIHQPKMLLDTCNLSGKMLEAGSSENLIASFQNRSASEEMYNLKITAASSGNGVKLGKNSWYFTKVSPGENAVLESLLTVAKDAESAENTLTFTFEYEDSKGTASTGTETLALTVTQPVRMELESMDFPTVVYASDTEELSVKALNLSRTKVYNARICLSGTGLFPTEEVFLGNLEAGTEEEGVMKVYVGTRTMEEIGNDPGNSDAEKYGPVSGTLTLTYEDGLGNVHEETKEYQTEIKKAQILSLHVSEEKETGNSWWYSVFAVVTAFLLLLVLALVRSLRRKIQLLKEAGR
ncbi:hypothetical protein DXA57_01470 [Blautia sp. OF03-15BH]|uniref:hypothetical protein n=1 Tax=Blautia sp. OF03-15BH TaxID=2292287 RepID=UPI000E53E5C4|nr:hypothetical protein [Blautia sp. OF03-15BH]RGY02983.1 hypothetical protein DXA57_01470 [Blautia sp. OF03-15BH]